MRHLPRFLSLACLVLVLPLAAPEALADVVHLRTGEAVKGRAVQELSTEEVLVVEDYLTGATRRFAWEAVDPDERDRLWEQWNWKNTGQSVVEAHRVVQRLRGGDTEELFGLKVAEDESSITLLRDGTELRVPKSQVVSIEEEEMDARKIWSPEQLYERQRQTMADEGVDLSALTARDHWRLATYADWAEAYEQAREHYAAAAADEDYLKRDLAADRLARVEGLLRDRAALAALRDIRLKLHMNLFGRVREMMAEFQAANPDASEEVMARLERLRAEYEAERSEELQIQAGRHFPKIVERLIEQKVREDDLAITDVTGWTRRELPEQAFQELTERRYMGRYDEVTPEEARRFWEGRPKRSWRRVSYGSGTFIIDPPKIKPPQRRRPRGGGRSRGSGAAPQIEIPKPPTRDQWWDRADQGDRSNWVMAYFVERSDLFEVDERDYRPCQLCHGAGLLSKTLQTGEILSYLCTRCGGAQNDVVVKFR